MIWSTSDYLGLKKEENKFEKMETILEKHIRYCQRRFLLWSHMNNHESRDILDFHWWYNIQQHHKLHLFLYTILKI